MTWQTSTEARDIVASRCAYAEAPALTLSDVLDCVTRTRHAQVWATATTYNYGDKVLPTTRNGYYFVCTRPGVSGGSEPTWPTLAGASFPWYDRPGYTNPYDPYCTLLGVGGAIADGTALWLPKYPDWSSPYDLDAATYEAWMLKAAKASAYIHGEADGQQIDAQQVYDHCIAMSLKYVSIVIG